MRTLSRVDMANVGLRLREERERLKQTQEDFAIACGVRRRAQVTYESGERSPDARYLEAASKIGVDIAYVIYGSKTTFNETIRLMVVEDLFFCICYELGFDDESVQGLVSNATPAAKNLYEKLEDAGGVAPLLVDAVKAFLAKSTKIIGLAQPDDLPHAGLLETVIEQLEFSLDQQSIALHPRKKALAVVMLYRALKTNGVIDKNIIDEIIALARS